MRFRSDINGLRAWAVMVVVLYHFGFRSFGGGFAGVDIFFVISGFLMTGIVTGILEKSPVNGLVIPLRDFYLARMRRISPALIVLCAVLLAIGWVALTPDKLEELGRESLSAIGFYSNILFLSQAGYFDSASTEKLLLHTWSLSVEWQFYLLLPLLLVLAWKVVSRRTSLYVALGLAFVISLFYSIHETYKFPDAAFYLIHSRAWELILGGIAYFFGERFTFKPAQGRALIHGAFIILLASAIFLRAALAWPGYYALIPTVATALILIVNQSQSIWTSARVFQWLGTRSYSLYLVHWPIVVYLHGLHGADTGAYKVGGVVVAIVLAAISYALIESPARSKFLRFNQAKWFVACAGVVGLVVVASAMTVMTSGFPSRYPESVVELSKYRFQMADYRDGTCFLNPDQEAGLFKDCTTYPATIDSAALLWGDSHAAHLYPGLNKTLPEGIALTQFTASGCPPFLDLDVSNRPNCRKINDYARDWILKNRPQQVIISAKWIAYDLIQVQGTINFLKSVGVKKIQLVGPVPSWDEKLPNILMNNMHPDAHGKLAIANRLTTGFSPDVAGVDAKLREIANAAHIQYVSPNHILCNAAGCMTTILDEHGLSPVAWDDSHLSVSASQYLISHSSIW